MTKHTKKLGVSQIPGRIKEELGVITNSESTYTAGKRERLIARLRKEEGLSKEEAEREADRRLKSLL